MRGTMNFRRILWSGGLAAAVAAAALGTGQVQLSGAGAPMAFQGRGGGAGGGAQATTSLEPLRFRYMGPAPAGRIASVVGVPGDPTTWYVGSASGGVWKSTDSGTSFTPTTDAMRPAGAGPM